MEEIGEKHYSTERKKEKDKSKKDWREWRKKINLRKTGENEGNKINLRKTGENGGNKINLRKTGENGGKI